MSGLTDQNQPQIASKLIEIGLQPDAGGPLVTRSDLGVPMREGQDMKRLREVAISLLGSEKGALFSSLVSQLNMVGSVTATPNDPKPDWAVDLSDHRSILRWDVS